MEEERKMGKILIRRTLWNFSKIMKSFLYLNIIKEKGNAFT